MEALQQALIEDMGDRLEADSDAVTNLFKPARFLKTEVLIHSELLDLHDSIGLGEVSEEHIDELLDYMGGALPGQSHDETVTTPTFPIHRDELGKGHVLSIAGSATVMQERVLVKAALANYYRLPRIPNGVWREDERTTRAWLARSGGPFSNGLLKRLKILLEENPDLLPAETEMGGVVLRPSPTRRSGV